MGVVNQSGCGLCRMHVKNPPFPNSRSAPVVIPVPMCKLNEKIDSKATQLATQALDNHCRVLTACS